MQNSDTVRQFGVSKTMAQICVIGMISASVLVPGITLSEALPWFKAEQLLLPIIFVVYALLLLTGAARTIRWNGLFIIALLYTISNLLSIWFGSEVLGQSTVLRDYYEFPKIWLPVIFFTIAYEAELSEKAIRQLLNVFAFAMCLVCLYAWGQWASLGITFKIDTYYSGGEHIVGALERYRRVFSTMGNANVLGQLLTWSVAIYLLAFLSKVGGRARNLGMILILLITLAMTGSRYGLLTTGLAIALVFILRSGSGRSRSQLALLVLLLPVFALIVAGVATTNKATSERFQTLQHPLEVDSLRTRLDDLWRDAGKDFVQSPFVGHGPAKSIYTDVITDSEYLDVLKKFGIIGFCVYLAYYLFPLYVLLRGLRAERSARAKMEPNWPASALVLRVGVVLIVTAMVMNIGETTFYSQVLQGFLWLWIGLAARCAKDLNVESQRMAQQTPLNRLNATDLIKFQPGFET